MMASILSGYLCLWLLFFVVILLDWLFGLDKVSSYIDNNYELSTDNTQIVAPLAGSAVFGIIFAILYLCTGVEIFKFGSYMLSALSLGGFILMGALYTLYIILCKVRNFFIHLRKGA